MNLSLYSPWQEENIFIRNEARTWRRSGLIDDDQLREIVDSTDPGLRLTNLFFRILFFVFACLCAGAIVALYVWLTDMKETLAFSLTFVVAGVLFYVLAERTAIDYHLYRHGIEEALAVSAMVLISAGMYIGAEELVFGREWSRTHVILLCLCFALSAGWIHVRFGYLYSAIIGLIALCVIPFQLGLTPTGERAMLLAILCLIFSLVTRLDRPEDEEFRKERSAAIQACLLVGIYFTVNLHIMRLAGAAVNETGIISPHSLFFPRNPALFPVHVYWLSYALTFLIPACGIYWGVKKRARLTIDVTLILACLTLVTNKSYLGWERYTWDPTILGTVLVALSLFIWQWLANGPGGTRLGFTEKDILTPETHGINLADVAAALTPGLVDTRSPETQPEASFGGGKSGGGGASRNL